ncbi:MAG: YceI family protein [Ilumatobacteraceae bacterium]
MVLPIAPGSYGIDAVHSQIGFAVTHLGISVIRGTFDRFVGELHVGDDLATTVVTVEVEVASLNSGSRDRDNSLLGPDFFDATGHPEMTFRSRSIVEEGSGYTMASDLTIKGITQPVTLRATFNGASAFPVDGSTHFGFTASGVVSRSSFGVSALPPLISDEASLTIDAQFVLPKVDP